MWRIGLLGLKALLLVSLIVAVTYTLFVYFLTGFRPDEWGEWLMTAFMVFVYTFQIGFVYLAIVGVPLYTYYLHSSWVRLWHLYLVSLLPGIGFWIADSFLAPWALAAGPGTVFFLNYFAQASRVNGNDDRL